MNNQQKLCSSDCGNNHDNIDNPWNYGKNDYLCYGCVVESIKEDIDSGSEMDIEIDDLPKNLQTFYNDYKSNFDSDGSLVIKFIK
jgi:hypothetical protein